MDNKDPIFYTPRKYNTIELWKNVTEQQWNNPLWQLGNSIRKIKDLKKVIKLNDYQAAEIARTLSEMKRQGKEPMRITPYYASLMQEDPFHPVMEEKNRLDPIFWQCVPTPANLLFPNTGLEAAISEGSGVSARHTRDIQTDSRCLLQKIQAVHHIAFTAREPNRSIHQQM